MFDRLYTEFKGHDAGLYALAFDGDDTLFSGGADKVVASWSLSKMTSENFAIRTDSGIYSLHLIGDHVWIGLVNGDIHVIDRKERKEVKHFKLHKKGTFDITSNGNTVITCGGDGTIGIWDNESLEMIRQIPLSGQKIRQAKYSPDGELVAICCSDGSMRILESVMFNDIKKVRHEEGAVNTCLWLDSGLVSGGWDGHLYLWDDMYTLKKKLPAHNFAIYDIVEMDDLILTGSRDKRIKVWNENLEPIERIEYPKRPGHKHSVNRLLVLDDERLVSAGDDKVIKIWQR